MASAHGMHREVHKIYHFLESAITAYTEQGIKGVSEVFSRSNIEVDTIPASFHSSSYYIKSWLKIQKAVRDNDHKTVRKKLIEHTLWRLEQSIEASQYDQVTIYLTALKKLGSLTIKQKKRLQKTVTIAQTIEQNVLSSTDWRTFTFAGLTWTGVLFTLHSLTDKKYWSGIATGLGSTGIFGLATYGMYKLKQQQLSAAPKITKLLTAELTKEDLS